MFNIEYENDDETSKFKRYTNGKGYKVTELVCLDTGKTEYRIFNDGKVDGAEYLPRIDYDNYSKTFEVFKCTYIDSLITDIDKLISEHQLFIDGLVIAKAAIKEIKDTFNL